MGDRAGNITEDSFGNAWDKEAERTKRHLIALLHEKNDGKLFFHDGVRDIQATVDKQLGDAMIELERTTRHLDKIDIRKRAGAIDDKNAAMTDPQNALRSDDGKILAMHEHLDAVTNDLRKLRGAVTKLVARQSLGQPDEEIDKKIQARMDAILNDDHMNFEKTNIVEMRVWLEKQLDKELEKLKPPPKHKETGAADFTLTDLSGSNPLPRLPSSFVRNG